MASITGAWQEEIASLLRAMGSPNDTQAANASDDNSMISLLKAVMAQNETIISNQTIIINKLDVGVNVNVLGGGL